MKSMDKAAKLSMLSDGDTKCVDLWEGEACCISYFHKYKFDTVFFTN